MFHGVSWRHRRAAASSPPAVDAAFDVVPQPLPRVHAKLRAAGARTAAIDFKVKLTIIVRGAGCGAAACRRSALRRVRTIACAATSRPLTDVIRLRVGRVFPLNGPREPILNLPTALTAYIVLLAVIHGVRQLLPADLDLWVIELFAFIPRRYDMTLLWQPLRGGEGAKIWTFLTYSLLHANIMHLAVNVLWLLPFGAAVARRFGAVRFFALMAVTAIAGAAAHLLTHAHELEPMIGASASVSGAMAAAIRFAFERGSFLSFAHRAGADAALVPAVSLSRALRNPQVLIFLAIWFGINIVFGVGSISAGLGVESVAWQAHIGGFLAGLLLFSLFDPIPRAGRESRPFTDPSDPT
jgi:membrane associated rhomboid family serine protease